MKNLFKNKISKEVKMIAFAISFTVALFGATLGSLFYTSVEAEKQMVVENTISEMSQYLDSNVVIENADNLDIQKDVVDCIDYKKLPVNLNTKTYLAVLDLGSEDTVIEISMDGKYLGEADINDVYNAIQDDNVKSYMELYIEAVDSIAEDLSKELGVTTETSFE